MALPLLSGSSVSYPFLDGFFLSDAPEFEAWAETELARLVREHSRALYQLAKQVGSSGHHTVEIECWRKFTAVDPLSERGATGLARARAAAGDWLTESFVSFVPSW